jgi:ATP-dependent RNA helicase DDX49/DBP8
VHTRPGRSGAGRARAVRGTAVRSFTALTRRPAALPSLLQSLGVAPWLVSTLGSLGITVPTSIQCQVIPPILQTLAKDPYGIYALVLTPTRELAFQLAEQFRVLGAHMGLRDAVVIGGLDMMPQALELAERPHVVIATPGRFADHVRSSTSMHLSHTRFLVLDEVDRLMEPKFRKDMDTILGELPPPSKRQTLLFSATMSKAEVLATHNQFGLRADNTDFCQVASDDDALVAQLDQQYLFMPQNIKEVYLVYMLSKSAFAGASCIVFVSTCRGCEVLAQLLLEVGIQCESLHSRKNQNRRLASLGKFRSGVAKVLVATDVASRGLDIPTVQLVVSRCAKQLLVCTVRMCMVFGCADA